MSRWGVVLNAAGGEEDTSDQHLILEEVAFELTLEDEHHPAPWRHSRPPGLGRRSARTAHSEPVWRPGSGSPELQPGLGTARERWLRPKRAGTPSASPPRAVGGCRAGVAKARSPGWVALAGKGFGVGRPDPGAGSGRGLGAWRAGGRSGGRGEGGAAAGGGSVRSRAQGQQWPPQSKAAWRERPGAEGLTGRRGRAEQVQIFPGTPGPGRPLSPVPLDPPPCAHAPSLFPAPRGRAPATTPAPALIAFIASEVPGVEFLGRGSYPLEHWPPSLGRRISQNSYEVTE
ncbi:hypothetical protein J1605_002028 [Eschrichtius robustus]|uniref:Uncharacterized protein n=1 Tax=Eschrichtius robustus TaxID=9764 RepID=A0AB34HXA0_ESCRO|nr:hypothetical protein J1605_002028 [Eschrichtius robustus]